MKVTTAPDTLLALRSYLALETGVAISQFGIVGDTAHTKGYHLGRDRIYAPGGQGDADYSIRLLRDRSALTDHASAIDIKFGTDYALLRRLSGWLHDRAAAGAVDCRDIREIVYSPDGDTVVRWDREKVPGGGDDSHRWHTHISYYRDTLAKDKIAPFRAFLLGETSGMKVTYQVRERWHPTVSELPDGTLRSNGVLRGAPNRLAPIVIRIDASEHITTIAEVIGDDGSNMRLVEWAGRDPLYALRSDWISEGFVDEPVQGSNKDGYNLAMREIAEIAAGKVIP